MNDMLSCQAMPGDWTIMVKVLATVTVLVCLFGLGSCKPRAESDPVELFDLWAANDATLEAVKLTDPAFYSTLRVAVGQDDDLVRSRATFEREMVARLRPYTLDKGRDLALAPDDDLLLSFAAERDLVSRLQSYNLDLCASFAMGRSPGFPIIRNDVKYLYERAAVARLIGALEGRNTPVRRRQASDADHLAVYQEMLRWSVPEPLARQLMERGLEGRSKDEQCDTVVAYYEAVLVQPKARAARLVASLQENIAASGNESDESVLIHKD